MQILKQRAPANRAPAVGSFLLVEPCRRQCSVAELEFVRRLFLVLLWLCEATPVGPLTSLAASLVPVQLRRHGLPPSGIASPAYVHPFAGGMARHSPAGVEACPRSHLRLRSHAPNDGLLQRTEALAVWQTLFFRRSTVLRSPALRR